MKHLILIFFLFAMKLSATPLSLDSQQGINWQCSIDRRIWQACTVPGNVPDKIRASGFFWLKTRFSYPPDRNHQQLSIRLGKISDKDITYLNGVEIGRTGHFNHAKPEAYDKIRLYTIPSGLLKARTNQLEIQVKSYFSYEGGILQDKVEIGATTLLQQQLSRQQFAKLYIYVVYATGGLYFLFLFFSRKKDKEYLYFALLTFCLSLYQFFRTQLKYSTGIDLLYLKKAEYLVLFYIIPFYSNFIREFLGYAGGISYRLLNGFFVILGALALFAYRIDELDFVNKYLVQPAWIPYVVISIYFLIQKMRQNHRDAAIIFTGMLFVLVATILDISSDRGLFLLPRTAPYGFAFFILSMAFVLAKKYTNLNQEVEELNANLEKKVEKRTRELKKALIEVTGLKNQQDADYFLTSALLKPLMSDENNNPSVKTELFSRQKKSFLFRDKQCELGGDISITSTLKLNGKTHTVFLNADAMGKSMQGAGGALVMGVVFHSILSRNLSSPNLTAEQWLKQVFLELQKTFESFQGTMYISCILGLVEQFSGQLYFINADHPMLVLYRQQQAKFIEKEIYLNKIGTPMNEQLYKCQTYPLKKGDILFIGSDGKDDLCMGYQAGRRIINHDETLFLQSVIAGNGECQQVVEKIMENGSLTDDISLLRLEYLGMAIEATALPTQQLVAV